MLCTTCGHPADHPYTNEAAHERCIDDVHTVAGKGRRVKPGAGIGREWLVESVHTGRDRMTRRPFIYYRCEGSYATLDAALRAL